MISTAKLAAGVARQRANLRVVAIVMISQLTAACVVPGHMHVTEGIAPQNVDTNVRFRTTYYFRAFDYCWNVNAPLQSGATSPTYRQIIPETDTLYRYRMTGQASALGSQIKFESGVLPKSQIEPFGADVTYNSDIGGYLVRSPEAAKAQAEAAVAARAAAAASAAADKASDAALARYNVLNGLLVKAPGDPTLTNAVKEALQVYLGTFHAPPDEAVANTLKDLKTATDALTSGQAATKADLAALSTKVDDLQKQLAAAKAAASTYCSADEVRTHGFQIMGPEGMRPFDQDSRLILAMHASAKPLIETLNEYSTRLLKPRANPAEQLLPLARETTTIVQTQRALDRVTAKIVAGGDTKPDVDAVFAAATEAFGPEPK